jgi:glucose-1-phosphate cytidylyltransferase
MADSDYWLNGGFFVFRQDIFDYIEPGDELVEEPFRRLASRSKLWTRRHNGFWRPMDTFKDKIAYDRMWSAEDTPWRLTRPVAGQSDDKDPIRIFK